MNERPVSERFKLKYFSSGILSILWARERPDYVPGDCYALACREACDVAALDRYAGMATGWSEPMTIDEVRAFIAAHPQMLGAQIHRCLGITLVDGGRRSVDFPEPLMVGNT